jgi:hypothetical protein
MLNVTSPDRQLAVKDPGFAAYLPIDDASWDNALLPPESAVQICSGPTLRMGPCSRLAQATHLLGQALELMSSTGKDETSQHVMQVVRTLQALVHTADEEASFRRQLQFCTQSLVSFRCVGFKLHSACTQIKAYLPCLA